MIERMDRKKLALIATIIGSGMVVLDGFVVNLALPKIAGSFHAQFSDLQWIVDAYLLFLSSLILVGGSLGDIFGRKKVYLIGLYGFTIGSVLCAAAPNTLSLIAFRIIQGMFGALLVPGGLAIINTNFPESERGAAIGRWSAWLAIVVPIGPLLGGYIISISSWRWIFLINLPLGVLCAWLANKNFRESRNPDNRRVDKTGAAIATLLLAGVTYGLIEGPASHWAARAVVPLAAGVLLFAAFIRHERRHPDPMVRLSLFRSRNFSGSNVMTFAMYGALGGFTFILPIYLQTKMGYSAFTAGLSMLPVSVLLLVLSRKMGALSAKYGPRLFITAGPLITAAAILSLIDYGPGDSFLGFLIPRTILFGIGMSLLVAPLTVTVMSSVENRRSGVASGVNNAVSRVAGLIVVALLGLAGGGNTFRFTVVLCALLAALAGVASYLTIQNNPKPLKVSD